MLPDTRARTIWGWLIQGLENQPRRRRDDALRLARWQLESGTAARPETLLSAARQAAEQVDLGLAARLLKGAQDADTARLPDRILGRTPARRSPKTQHMATNDAFAFDDGRPRSGLTAISTLSLYWGSVPPGESERPGAGGGATNRSRGDGGAGPDDGAAKIVQAWFLLGDGRCRDALDTIASGADRPGGLTERAQPVAVLANALLGRIDLALAVADRAAADAEHDENVVRWRTTLIDWSRCLALRLAGRLRDAAALAEKRYAAAVAQGAREVAIGWGGFRGGLAMAQGMVVTAQTAMREAAAALDGRDVFGLPRYVLAELAGAAALAGDAAGAIQWMERADALQHGRTRLFDPWIERNRAWVIAANEDGPGAAAHTRLAADLAGEAEQYAVEALVRYDAARLGAAQQVLPRLDELAGVIDGPLAPTLHTAAKALAGSDGHALDAAAAALDDLGFVLHAAELACAAARAHQTAGRADAAAAARVRTALLLDRCEGAHTPLLRDEHVTVFPALSPREREVALLAAAGLPSKAIAERLSLSRRTVDNHLGRVYTKLGVPGRTGLAALIDASGDPRRRRPTE
jgi:DNA-binding CsgD family transcriptional regulator